MNWMSYKGNVIWITMIQLRSGRYIVAFDLNTEPIGFAANRVQGSFPDTGLAICAAQAAAHQEINS